MSPQLASASNNGVSRERIPPPSDAAFDPRWYGAAVRFETWHFHRQLLARYGIVLAPGEFSMIASGIRKDRAFLVRRRGKFATYDIRLPRLGKRIFVVARAGGRPITVYPPSKWTNAKRRALGLPQSKRDCDLSTDYVLRWRLLRVLNKSSSHPPVPESG